MDAKDMVTIPREVLEKFQWVGVVGYKECAFCDGDVIVGHREDCPVSIALKPKEEVPEPAPVQHEMIFNGEKYRTVFNAVIGSCYGCDLEAACSLKRTPADSDRCLPSHNADKKNRVWEKVAVLAIPQDP